MLGRRLRGISAIALGAASLFILFGRVLVPAASFARLVLDSFLPWFALIAVVALLLSVTARSLPVVALCLVPAVAWSLAIVPRLLPLETPASSGGSATSLSVVTQNLGSDPSAIPALIDQIVAEKPDLIALEELTSDALGPIQALLADDGYSQKAIGGTVGVWSTLPVRSVEALDLGLGWERAVRLDVTTAVGSVRVYAVHAASARPSGHAERDRMLAELATVIAADPSQRLILAGDFNATLDDQAMAALLGTVSEPRMSGGGFGFTWPAGFPATRPDHVLLRGMTATAHAVLRAAGSDHLGVAVTARTDR